MSSNSNDHKISHDYQEGTHHEPASSDASQEVNVDTEDERQPPQLPASVVAVNYRSNLDDNRSISSQRSESGYHSSGALSDGPAVAIYTATSSLRSVGSVGSHGSGGRDATATAASTIYGSETRYSVAISSYATSETAKSDIATVCSGSVVEDIEISSVDMNVPQTPNSIFPSPYSERSVLTGGTNFRRSVEFAPSSFIQQFHKQFSVNQTSEYMRFSAVHPNCDQASENDMGPPLSRALLMQGGLGSATNSRAGSVRSFGSNGASQNSDVVAHVDTDDCGGSLVESVTDAQSIHSQEDIRSGAEGEAGNAVSQEYREKGEMNETHPLLKNDSSTGYRNGRTSPGGTIYKGKGVRRYQGRYMNLPLKRFNQDASTDLVDTVLEADKVMKEEENKQRISPQRIDRYSYENFEYRRGHGRSPSPKYQTLDSRYHSHGRSPSSGRNNGYQTANGQSRRNPYHDHQHNYEEQNNSYHKANTTHNGYHNVYSRNYSSRSRSRSRSSSPRRNRSNRRRWKQSGSRNCDTSSPARRRWNNTSNHNNETSPPSRVRQSGWNGSDLPPGMDSRRSHSPRRRRRQRSRSRG
mmetsp:Transcript_24650/g.36505  ORF Transcript_24650/g.36505 Transcript_24650/m.36505 type:complete len:581 (-) Transcript_24650:127-1869(-)